MASLTGSAISVSAPVMRQIKATNGISSLNSVSFFGQKRSFPSSLRLSISCHARGDDIFDNVRNMVSAELGIDESEILRDASFIEDLGADSLAIVELVAALEKRFEIRTDIAQSISTVSQAVDLVDKLAKR